MNTSSPRDDAQRHPLFIVGVDGSESGLAALRRAGEEAEQAGARVLCVHVRRHSGLADLAAYLTAASAVVSRECRDLMEIQAWTHCVQTLDPLGLSWDFRVVSGRPAQCLGRIAATEHGDALFVGRLPRPSWSRWLHRCPARKLARSDVCPVHIPSLPSTPSPGTA
jgi:nucleotide-binding universal stress UspA family protein